MLNIAVFGQSRWGSLLSETVNSMSEQDCRAMFVDVKDSLKPEALRAVREADVLMRVGFRPGAPTARGVAFDTLWWLYRKLNRRAQAAHFWVGTDVSNTVSDVRRGRIRRSFQDARRDLHLATSPWLVEELASVGIDSHYVVFFDAIPQDVVEMEMPERLPLPFTVLTYIPDQRPEFYGASMFYECARALPNVRFEVVGGTGATLRFRRPENLIFLGWQNIAEVLRRTSVVVRMAEHDGLGGTVRQGLAAGRHVIYNYALPHVRQVGFGATAKLIQTIAAFYRAAQSGGLATNLAGREYALYEFDVERHCRSMLKILKTAQ